MSEPESKPSLKPRVALRFEVEAPFGVLDFETEDAIYESPFYAARYSADGANEGTILIHWFNSTLRIFKDSPMSTHLDYRNDDGRLQGIGIDDDLIEQMLEYDWPRHEIPLLAGDPASMNWLAARAIENIDDEWDNL